MLKRRRTDKAQAAGRGWEGARGVLLVCDDPDAGEVLARLLIAAGHDLDRVETAEGTVRHLVSSPKGAVVLSLAGPKANLALLDKIRAHPNAPVHEVAVVVLADDLATGRAAWEAGADGFLARPFHAEQLTAELAAALDRPLDARADHRAAQLDAD